MDDADFKYDVENSVKCKISWRCVIAAAAALPTLRHDLFFIYSNWHQKWKAHHLPYAAAYLLPFQYVQKWKLPISFFKQYQEVSSCNTLCQTLLFFWLYWDILGKTKSKNNIFQPAEFFSADQKLTHFWLCLAHSNPMESKNYEV